MHWVVQTGYIGSRSNYSFDTECNQKQYDVYLREREREGLGGEGERRKEGWTVINYANDQLGERSFDSFSVVNAIAIWQFAAVQVHLTRFKSRPGVKKKKKGKTRQKIDRRELLHLTLFDRLLMDSRLNGERILTGISLFILPSRLMLDIAELTRHREAFRRQVYWDWILDCI